MTSHFHVDHGNLPGYFLGALVVLALVASFVRPVAVDGLLSGAIATGVLWFGQLLSRFLA